MALMLASASYSFMNPVQAVINQVAAASIVGIDQRALKRSVAEKLQPQRALKERIQRAAQHIVMEADAGVTVKRSGNPDAPPAIVGDLGFDPLNLGKEENFAFMREAEIKHGRLAMMAAIAWPTQEIFNPILTDLTGASKDVLAVSGGASPSLLNGGLFQLEVLPALIAFTAGVSYLEQKDLTARKGLDCEWNEYPASFGTFGRQPGNFGFDPLNFYRPLNAADRVAVQERELLNGRVAMMAVLAYVVTEFVGQTTIVRATPALFEPIIIAPWFRNLMDASFGMASMDGSIEGVAF